MTNTEIGRSLASSFVEMAAALDKLPQVEADLLDAHAALDKANARIAFLESHNSELGDRVVKAEADLAQATKSATGHKANVDLMLDEIRKATGQLLVLTDIVDPKPVEVEPEVALPNPLHVGENNGQSAPMTGEDTSREAGTNYSPWDKERWSIPQVKEVVQVPDYIREPVETPSPFVDPTSSSGNSPSTGTGETMPTTSGQSDIIPTASASTTTNDASTAGASPNTDVGTPNATHGEPNSRPYWLKPSNMSWRSWQSLNGEVPHWVGVEMMDLM